MARNDPYEWLAHSPEVVEFMSAEPLDMALEILRLRRELQKLSTELDVLRQANPDRTVVGEFVLPNYSIPTYNNVYAHGHWGERYRMMQEIQQMTAAYCRHLPVIEETVNVHVVAHRKRTIDADNVAAKAIIDGLRYANILPDDRKQHVNAVTTRCDKSNIPQVTVTLWK